MGITYQDSIVISPQAFPNYEEKVGKYLSIYLYNFLVYIFIYIHRLVVFFFLHLFVSNLALDTNIR